MATETKAKTKRATRAEMAEFMEGLYGVVAVALKINGRRMDKRGETLYRAIIALIRKSGRGGKG